MDATELAKKMLEWRDAQARADLLKMDIEAAVLELGKTQTVGSVRATYSAGRKAYDYQTAVEKAWYDATVANDNTRENLFQDLVNKCSITKYDYRAVCEGANIDNIPFTQSAPSVALKIVA